MAYILLFNLSLYDLYPEYTAGLPRAEEFLKFHPSFSCYTIFNLSDLLSMAASCVLLAGLLWSRLKPDSASTILADFEALGACGTAQRFDASYARFVEKYGKVSEETRARDRRNRYFIKGVAAVMVVLVVFAWYEQYLGKSDGQKGEDL